MASKVSYMKDIIAVKAIIYGFLGLVNQEKAIYGLEALEAVGQA